MDAGALLTEVGGHYRSFRDVSPLAGPQTLNPGSAPTTEVMRGAVGYVFPDGSYSADRWGANARVEVGAASAEGRTRSSRKTPSVVRVSNEATGPARVASRRIGRATSVAKALRTLLKVTAARDGEPVSLEIL